MSVIKSLEDEYRRYKALAEAAIAQVGDEELTQTVATDADLDAERGALLAILGEPRHGA